MGYIWLGGCCLFFSKLIIWWYCQLVLTCGGMWGVEFWYMLKKPDRQNIGRWRGVEWPLHAYWHTTYGEVEMSLLKSSPPEGSTERFWGKDMTQDFTTLKYNDNSAIFKTSTLTCKWVHPWKLTWQTGKSPLFNRKCIFKWWMFHCHSFFYGGNKSISSCSFFKCHCSWKVNHWQKHPPKLT